MSGQQLRRNQSSLIMISAGGYDTADKLQLKRKEQSSLIQATSEAILTKFKQNYSDSDESEEIYEKIIFN